ncbi:response regulator transcription factor [Amycolatopsis sp. EV170708-02-1]|uniref:response regulator transcription factor n=1 Tax=Amycolatopsis sp. EV170708-02-1 TaxID=2919322 RepID=UPI001F0B8976|nr:response regulator transcription factor [Amycolatopsis sp. EV170708-02-1]UMP00080.1 response regulator transcription factor [Amycolatopsis sp. EV170708-02-1]
MNRVTLHPDAQRRRPPGGSTPPSSPTATPRTRHALSGKHDLLLLDIGLPAKDGFAVLHQLRQQLCTIPVIILTARGGVADTVAGLDGGADDYLSKPFRFTELLARIRRRVRDDHGPSAHQLRHGRITLDLHSRVIEVDGRTIELTAREFTLAETFLRSDGEVLTREHLLATIWGPAYDGESNIVDVYVRYLRRKVSTAWITTVRGKGYRLNNPVTALPAHHDSP